MYSNIGMKDSKLKLQIDQINQNQRQSQYGISVLNPHGRNGQSFPLGNVPAVINKSFQFKGKAVALEARLDQLTDDEILQLEEVCIYIEGNLVQQGKYCLMVLTIMFACLIFPICLCYTNCWRKTVANLYQLSPDIYKKVCQKLLRSQKLKSFVLKVQDNLFDEAQARDLTEALKSASRLKFFFFSNMSTKIDYKGNESSNFQQNMRRIKNIESLGSVIKWNDQQLE